MVHKERWRKGEIVIKTDRKDRDRRWVNRLTRGRCEEWIGWWQTMTRTWKDKEWDYNTTHLFCFFTTGGSNAATIACTETRRRMRKLRKGVTRLRKNTPHRTHSSDLFASMRNIPHTLPHPTPLRVVFLALPKSAPAFAVPVYPSLRYPPASQFVFRQLGREHPDSDGRPLETISRGRSHRKQVMLR